MQHQLMKKNRKKKKRKKEFDFTLLPLQRLPFICYSDALKNQQLQPEESFLEQFETAGGLTF